MLLYNCRTEKITVVQPELYLMLHGGKLDILSLRHKAFYDYLCKEGYLVDDDLSESDAVIEQWKQENTSETSFGVFVNPTLDCNMKCWYCYEKHRPKQAMGTAVQTAVMKLFHQKISDEKLIFFNLGFFGGEPLLEFDSVVMPLIKILRGAMP